ncbi:MAG: DNA polymerase III subunit gamma/tau [Gemmatimonadaceae bacterium]|nr:DNA polymerase III subunit gamma/tau [Gloeobacterales cyanobacterium ES-bin-141]
MGYEPLYQKYRPQRFSEMVGQEPIVTTLTNAIHTGRVAHAYLFTGSRGTGKTTTARLIAKALNCEHGPTPEPCGKCTSCLGVINGNALDVIEIDAASNTGVDNIRELIERAQFAPVQGRSKIYIIDESHMLSGAAFNALLKTLEEPPPRVVFVLATTDPQKVLPTVISRCQRFDFRRIPMEAMVKHLKQISRAEGIDIEPTALELVAQLAQGGLRDAQSLLDQLSLLEGPISTERVWQLVGAVSEFELLALAESIERADSVRVLEQVRHLLDNGKEPIQVLQDLLAFYRDLLIACTAPERRDLAAVSAPTWQQMVERAVHYSVARILDLQGRLAQAQPQLKGTTQPRLWLEVSLLGLLNPPAAVRTATTIPQPTSLPATVPMPAPAPTPRSQEFVPAPVRSIQQETTPAVPPASKPPPAPAPAIAPAPAVRGDVLLSEHWEVWIKDLDPPTQGLMRQSFVLKESPLEVVLGFGSNFFVRKVTEPKRFKLIQESLRLRLGRAVQVRFEISVAQSSPAADSIQQQTQPVEPPTPPAIESSPRQVADSRVHQTLEPDPKPIASISPAEEELDRMVHRLADFFDGEIVNWDDENVAGRSLVDENRLYRPAGDLPAIDPGAVPDDDEDIPF